MKPAPDFGKPGKGKRKPAKNGFIDLGEEPMEMPVSKSKPHKYYPSIRMRKSGIKTNVGKVGTAIVRYRVKGIELRDGESPETNLELQGIKDMSHE